MTGLEVVPGSQEAPDLYVKSGTTSDHPVGSIPVLYISYDGLLEPLGESQVVAYLERLAKRGRRMMLLSFEKPNDAADRSRFSAMQERLSVSGIEWKPLRYHKRPSLFATAYDVARGVTVAFNLVRRGQVRLIHARGYVASLIALAMRRLCGVKFLFDMRGFWADEKVDGGHWAQGSLLYRVTKFCERSFFESADGIVSLTEAGVESFESLGYNLQQGVPVVVIPTCTDLARFHPGSKDPELVSRLGLQGRVVIGCTGTVSNWYLRQSMLDCLASLAQKDDRLRFLMVTREDHRMLLADAERAGLAQERLVLTQVPYAMMPHYVRLIDVGLFFIKPCFAKKGSSATKLGEFLATGVPVVINDGVGDSGLIVKRHGVGVVLPGVEPADFVAAGEGIKWMLDDPDIARRCRETAERYFDLEAGVRRYDDIYTRLAGLALGTP